MPYPRFHPAPLALAVALAIATLGTSAVHAQLSAASPVGTTFNISLAAQPLGTALNELARQAKLQLMVHPDLVAGKSAPAVSGNLTARQALERLLTGSGLTATMDGSAVVVRAIPVATGTTTLPAVTVTANADWETAASHVGGYVAKRSATGTKTDTPIIETPQSISVVTADFIEATAATRISDALGYTPGVGLGSYGTDSRYDWVFLRGFDAYSPGFYLDGLQLRNIGTYGVWQTENYGAERIEVLRGPTSVLYGQTGPGGMINVVSKRPTAEPVHEIQTQLGEHSRQVAGDFSGALDAEGKLLYRVTGLVRDAKLQDVNVSVPDDRVFIAPSLTWRPSSDTSLTVLSQYSRTRTAASYRPMPLAGTLLSNPNGSIPSSTYLGEPGFDHFNQDQWMLGYLFEHRLNDTWTVRQNARYSRLELDYMQAWARNSFTSVNPSNAADPANYRRVGRYVFGSQEKANLFTIDNQAQVNLKLGDWQHNVLLGLDYQRTHYDQAAYYGGSVPSLDLYAPTYGSGAITIPSPYKDVTTKLAQTGFYVQDQIKWGGGWVATLGGRYDHASINTDNNLTGSTSDQTDHKFTGRAGLVYLAPNGWAPYVSYSESFSPTTTINPDTNKPFSPETGQQYEAGVRYQPVGRKDSYSAAVFDLRRQNYITYDTSSGASVAKQTGEVTVRGLELEAKVQPISQLNVTAAYTWIPKAVVTASSTPSEVGKQMYAVPESQLSLWVDYRFSTGVKVGLGARYVGSTHGYQESLSTKVPAYTLFDAMIGYDFERWSLALNARNLTDKVYFGSNCGPTTCMYGERRKVVATATYRW